MAAGRTRSTRKLRSWIVEQVNSGKYPGVTWDDDAKTMFRIPWKHAGKQDFRKDEDAALFKAWAEFKGKLPDGVEDNPASWKTRLRCALNKSPEFSEVMERAQLDISDPYKVYRLVPLSEQGMSEPEKKSRVKAAKRSKNRRSSQLEDDSVQVKIKKKEVTSQQVSPSTLIDVSQTRSSFQRVCWTRFIFTSCCVPVTEIMLDFRIEESLPASPEVQDSFEVVVCYSGKEILKRRILGADLKIMYQPSSPIPPIPATIQGRFPRILLPDPPSQDDRLLTLLPLMQQGVLLTSMTQGIYGKRSCQAQVFWSGPHTTSPGPHKLDQNTEPVLLFSKDVFKQQLDHYRSNGGEPPQSGITLSFGEEPSSTDDPSVKHIILKIKFPWAEKQLQGAAPIMDPITILQSLASQSPLGELTLNLVPVTAEDAV
uniref:Interferon regulatory factor 9 n=1 Tax=Takifugu rubripes TaxID=31033 RepID=A0A674MIG1_TAKRU